MKPNKAAPGSAAVVYFFVAVLMLILMLVTLTAVPWFITAGLGVNTALAGRLWLREVDQWHRATYPENYEPAETGDKDDYPYITADSVLKSLPPDVRIAFEQCPRAPKVEDLVLGSTTRTSFHPGGVVLNDFAD